MFTPPIPLSVDTFSDENGLMDYFASEFKHLPLEDYSKVLDLMSRAYKIGKDEATKRAANELKTCVETISNYYSIL